MAKGKPKNTPTKRPASQASLLKGQHQAHSKAVKKRESTGAPAVGSDPQPPSAEDGQHPRLRRALISLIWRWEVLKGIGQSLVTVSVLLVLLSVITQRWLTEIGDHEKTRGELARERESKGNVTAERDELKKERAALKKENVVV